MTILELINLLAPWLGAFVGGYYAGKFYGYHQYCRKCLGAVLFIIWKLDKRGTFFTPYDRAVIQVAVDHIRATK